MATSRLEEAIKLEPKAAVVAYAVLGEVVRLCLFSLHFNPSLNDACIDLLRLDVCGSW